MYQARIDAHGALSYIILEHGRCGCRRKLLKAFYSERKQQFDISKVPDIYDSAKYDAIHNSELGLTLKPLYQARRHDGCSKHRTRAGDAYVTRSGGIKLQCDCHGLQCLLGHAG